MSDKVDRAVYLESVETGNNSMIATMRSDVVPIIAAHFAEMFEAHGASNYIGFELHHETLGPLMLTLQRANGETPEKQARERQERIAELETTVAQQAAEISELKTECDYAKSRFMEMKNAYEEVLRNGLIVIAERDAAQAALETALEANNSLQSTLTIAHRETTQAWVKCQSIVTDARASLPKTAEAQGVITTIINDIFDAAMGCDSKETPQ